MTKTNPWFRIHSQAMSNPKIQRLDAETFKIWFNLLCVTNDDVSSIIRETKCNDIIYALRVSQERYNEAISLLIERDLLIEVEGGYQPKDWHEWQYTGEKKGSSTARVQKFRDKKRQQEGPIDGVSKTLQKRSPEAETETDKETPLLSPKGDDPDLFEKPKSKRASQIPDGFPDVEARAAAVAFWRKQGRSDLNANTEAAAFRDNKLQNGKTHKDWKAAWRTWIRNAVKYNKPMNGTKVNGTGVESVSPDRWRERLQKFSADPANWSNSWGPKPNEPGCHAPAEVLQQFNERQTA